MCFKNILLRISFPLNFKDLLAEKCREGLDKECDGINGMYRMCVDYLGKQMKPVEDFSFHVDDF
jgi:hypothetical protein